MKMHNPAHPGAILREDILPSLAISVTEAATQLGVGRVTFSRVLHENAAISVDMARRLERWLGNPSAGAWLRMQTAYDLWRAENDTPDIDVINIRSAAARAARRQPNKSG